MAYFTTLYSGSSGNCALIRSEDKYLLIDMGKSCRTTLTALKTLGLAVSDCVGILVTHEHSDHVSGLDTFLKKHPVPLYGCADTLDTLASRGTIPPAVEAIPVDGQTLEIGSFTVTSFPTSHDVPCCGYRIRTPEGRVMAFATDLGYLTPVVQDNLMGCDLVALEANYDAFSLHGGPYPYYLKVRIASDRGHLDNKACAAEILDLIQDGCKKFALCHLSQTNNSPELVMTTVYNVLLAAGIQPGRDVLIQTQSRSEVSPYTLRRAWPNTRSASAASAISVLSNCPRCRLPTRTPATGRSPKRCKRRGRLSWPACAGVRISLRSVSRASRYPVRIWRL